MTEIFRFVGVCLLAVLLMQTLKGTNPTGALMVLVGAVLLLSVWGLSGLQNVLSGLERLVIRSGLDAGIYLPVIKVVGIAASVQIASAACKDAGAAALASQLELAGACAAIVVCLPLFERVLVIADALLD